MIRGAMLLTPKGLLFAGRRLPCTHGRGGIRKDKREGDLATPSGLHRITGLLFRPDRIAAHTLPRWATPIRPGDLWCDDPQSPAYNHLVRAPFAARHEVLRRADPLYDLVLTTDWNWPLAVPSAGSAIFIHTWRRPGAPTAGCLGLSRADLLWLAARIVPQTALIIPPRA